MTPNRSRPGPDYTLQWPRALFIREAKAALQATGAGFKTEVDLLLADVTVGQVSEGQSQNDRASTLHSHAHASAVLPVTARLSGGANPRKAKGHPG